MFKLHRCINTPDPEGFRVAALLPWRFAARHAVRIHPDRAVARLSPRGNQMALPLLSLVDDANLRLAIGARLATAEARAAATRTSRPHVALAGVLERLFEKAPYVPVADATEALNGETSLMLPIKSVGHIIRRDLGLATMKTRGVYVVPHPSAQRWQSLSNGTARKMLERHSGRISFARSAKTAPVKIAWENLR